MKAEEQKTYQALLSEVEELRARLAESEERRRAIRYGAVEALVVAGPEGRQDFTPEGAEQAYRVLFEAMQEGAVTLNRSDIILLCNHRFAELVRAPREQVIGASIHSFVGPEHQAAFRALLQPGRAAPARAEIVLRARDGSQLPVYLAINALPDGSAAATCLVVTDLSALKAAQAASREAQTRFHNMFESAPDAMAYATLDGVFLDVNQSFARLTGYSREELLANQQIYQLMTPEDQSIHVELIRRAINTGEPVEAEKEYIKKDGSRVPVSVTALTVKDPDGQPIGLAAIVKDISERRRAEAAWRREIELIELLKTVTIAAHEASTIEVAVQHCLDQVCHLTQWPLGHLFLPAKDSPDQLEATALWHADDEKRFEEFIHATEKFRLMNGNSLLGRVRASEKAIWINDVTQDANFIRAGAARAVGLKAAFAFPVLIGTNVMGIIEFFSTYAQEPDERLLEVMMLIGTQLGQVIERKRAEETLRESELRFRSVTQSAREAIVSANSRGEIISWNKGAEIIFGYAEAEVIGQSLTILMPEYYRAAHQSGLERLERTGESHAMGKLLELEGLRKGGASFPLELSLATWNAGEESFYSGIMRDITERQEAQQRQLQRERHAALRADVSAALAESVTLPALLQACAEAVTQHLDAAFARIWTLNQAERMLELQASAGIYTHLDGPHGRVPVGQFKIGLIAEERQPHLTNDVLNDPRVGDKEWAAREGMRAFAGYPLIVGNQLVGVIAMFARAPLAEETLEALASVAGHVAQGIERKHAEEALRAREQLFRSLMENSSDGIILFSADGAILYASPSTPKILGFTPEEMVNFNAFDLISEDDHELMAEHFARVFSQPRMRLDAQARVRHQDGSLRWLEGTFTNLLDEPNVGAIVNNYRDITERKRIEEALEAAAQRESAMIENSVDVICSIDAEGRFVTVSPSCFKLLGYRPEELIGRRYIALVAPEDVAKTNEVARAIMSGQEMSDFENRYQHKNGSLVDVMWAASWSESEQLMFCVAHDNTERKRFAAGLAEARDAALESTRLKSEFLANMSHEIRTPMNGVIGMIGLLLATPLSPQQREFAKAVETSADLLLVVINDILDFSKIESGNLLFEKINFKLATVLEETVEVLALRAQAKGIELSVHAAEDIPAILRGDPGRLRQVLLNLIGNAVKFTEQGEVTVRAIKDQEDEADVVLRFTVTDTGIGISAAVQKNLFQPFIQADGSTTRKYGGTGLGLAICKQLVALMDGEMGVASEVGQGATFWFTARLEKHLAGSKEIEVPLVNLSGRRLLIVDGHDTNRELLIKQTTTWGMHVAEAASGRRAIELLRTQAAHGTPFEMAIIDLKMPDMDGFALARAIREERELAQVRLVMLTAIGIRGHGEMARQLGIAAYLTKPVRQSQLLNCIGAVISQAAVATETLVAPELITRHTLNLAREKFSDGSRILITEDNLMNQTIVLNHLEKLGYQADTVANGAEALAALEKRSYCVVLMDCQMPVMDGFAATAEIRRREGTSKHTTIIAMTANALAGDRAKCLAAGMDDYLSKPTRPHELKKMLERWIPILDKDVPGMAAETGAPVPTHASVDLTVLAGFRAMKRAGKPDLVSQLIDMFNEDIPQRLAFMRAALVAGDVASLQRAAHSVKGSSANIGAHQLALLSEQLEQVCQNELLKGTEEVLRQLENEFGQVRQVLQAERQRGLA